MKQTESEHIQALAEAVRQSDRKAFDDLFRDLYPQLVGFSVKYTRDKAASCDIAQEAFVKLWQLRSNIDPNQSLKAYMFKSVKNRSLNWLRKRANQNISMDEYEMEQTEVKSEVGVNSQELAEMFTQWIQRLPARQQEAFELSRFEGLDHDEIADVMEVSPKTVNNHIVTALRYLRECYEAHQQKLKQE